MNRSDALLLMQEFTASESLRKHILSVEVCMRWYATHFKESPENFERWGIAGLLHDFDYERYPNPEAPEGHPFKGNQILKERGVDAEICEAIMGHALYTGVARATMMAKVLFAVDELSGLVTASILVRPDKDVAQLQPSSVMKKMKDKAFARGCNREDIRLGAQELGIELETHVGNVITAMRESRAAIGI